MEKLDKRTWKIIQRIAVFLGYNSNDTRRDNLWYVVTQLKIWQIANPNGTYYFTNSLNGTKINTYDYLLDELETDIFCFSQSSGISLARYAS